MPRKIIKKKKPMKRPKKIIRAPENKMRKKPVSNKAGTWVRDPVRPTSPTNEVSMATREFIKEAVEVAHRWLTTMETK